MPIVNFFGNGIVNDSRDTSQGVCRVCTNFDINSNPRRLVPYRDSEDGFSGASTGLMKAWCVALRTGTTYSLYGLGRTDAADKVRIFYKDLTIGASNDLDDNAWTETANNVSATVATVSYNCFVFYPKTAMIYGIHGARYVFVYDPSGSASFGETTRDLGAGIVNTAQGIVHSKDDTLYIPYDNKIASLNNATWTTAAITIPVQYYITRICEFNNYIAIAASPVSGVGNSKVFLWDRTSTLNTLTENIDWGYGSLRVLEELDGFLVGISVLGNSTLIQKNRITFRYYTGAGAQSFKEIFDQGTGSQTTILGVPSGGTQQQKIGNRVHFIMSLILNGTRREGVWSFGKNAQGVWSIVHERTAANDTVIDTGGMRGFFYVGDYLFQAYLLSSAYTVSKTNDAVSYTATSIYETQINFNMADVDKPKKKQLDYIAIQYTTLSAVSGQCVVKCSVDGGSFTTVLTCTTTGTNVIEQIIDSSTGLPITNFREIAFRLESTLGAEIISLSYGYTPLETLIK